MVPTPAAGCAELWEKHAHIYIRTHMRTHTHIYIFKLTGPENKRGETTGSIP